jgi:hypothetical protein
VQSDPRVAIAATVGAFESRRLLRSLCAPGSFISSSLFAHSLYAHSALPYYVSSCQTVFGLAFPCVGVDGALDQDPFACILEPQLRASCFPINLDQLDTENIFWNTDYVLSLHMAEPSV